MTATDSSLEVLDPAYVAEVLSRPPFAQISGVCNVRDLGSYHTTTPNLITKPGFAFRGAEVSHITEEGIQQMRSLGITTVFDLRSDPEMLKYSTPIPDIEGVQIFRTPVFATQDYSPETIARFVGITADLVCIECSNQDRRLELYALGTTEAFMKLYTQILEHGGRAFGTILRHVRDRPNSPFLFHCTAGKDRTGIIAAILLKLAGVEDHLVCQDYSLTRIGREPDRKKVLERLSKEPLFAANSELALRMLDSRYETMQETLNVLDDKYGGVEAYVKRFCGLTDNDISTIKSNLLT